MAGMSYQAPLYLQMRELVRSKIEEGEYPPLTALPSECELAESYGITRQTVRNAIDILVQEGLLRQVPGKGVYVLCRKMERNLDELQGFTQTMLDKRLKPSSIWIKSGLNFAGPSRWSAAPCVRRGRTTV